MPTMVADLAVPPGKVMLDTNVLLAATDESRTEHNDALRILNDWPSAASILCTSGQILREYLAVATRPADKNGLGLKMADALANVSAIRERSTLLAEDTRVAGRLLSLLGDISCKGKQVHDANVVATMLAHGIEPVVTRNLDDFARFGQFITLIGL